MKIRNPWGQKCSMDEGERENPMIATLSKDRGTAAERAALFENLMRASYRQAYAFAYRLAGNQAEAEDLVQESFLRAYRFFHRYDEGLPFINWLYRIMGNAHIDAVRRKGRLKTMSLEQPGQQGTSTAELPDASAVVDRQLMDGTMNEPVQRALGAMNAEFRTAVLLADVEGMAYDEIAEVMNTSVGTVRSRIHRGRKQLRTFLVRNFPSQFGGAAE